MSLLKRAQRVQRRIYRKAALRGDEAHAHALNARGCLCLAHAPAAVCAWPTPPPGHAPHCTLTDGCPTL